MSPPTFLHTCSEVGEEMYEFFATNTTINICTNHILQIVGRDKFLERKELLILSEVIVVQGSDRTRGLSDLSYLSGIGPRAGIPTRATLSGLSEATGSWKEKSA